MKNIAKSLDELVGGTPLLELVKFAQVNGAKAHIIAKLEMFNPAGSIKDRVAKSMIDDLEQRGVIAPGATLIEPTSGNTGIGLAFVAAARGYRLILTMPESMSLERRMLLTALGAELHLTPAAKGMRGAIERADELCEQIAGAVILNQFANPANPSIHYTTTAEEIWCDSEGMVDVVVAGVGTGGTISGVGARLKELSPTIEMIAVEPEASPVLSCGVAAPHPIQGIGAGFIPKNFNAAVVDRIITVSRDEAFAAARQMASLEGLLVGVSSGAALSAALKVASQPQYHCKRVVVILPDSGERYLSTALFNE
ncbi:MAG: cysteine synthase A [Rikenellaceae bacterium]